MPDDKNLTPGDRQVVREEAEAEKAFQAKKAEEDKKAKEAEALKAKEQAEAAKKAAEKAEADAKKAEADRKEVDKKVAEMAKKDDEEIDNLQKEVQATLQIHGGMESNIAVSDSYWDKQNRLRALRSKKGA